MFINCYGAGGGVELPFGGVKASGVGREYSIEAFEDFTAQGGPWQNKDVYLFCYRFDGTCACQGANKALVGKNLLDMQTADGVFLVKDIIEIARTKGSGSLEYQWAHPQTKKIATKASFVARVPGEDVVIGAGIYK